MVDDSDTQSSLNAYFVLETYNNRGLGTVLDCMLEGFQNSFRARTDWDILMYRLGEACLLACQGTLCP
jgi:hypothetical protein